MDIFLRQLDFFSVNKKYLMNFLQMLKVIQGLKTLLLSFKINFFTLSSFFHITFTNSLFYKDIYFHKTLLFNYIEFRSKRYLQRNYPKWFLKFALIVNDIISTNIYRVVQKSLLRIFRIYSIIFSKTVFEF